MDMSDISTLILLTIDICMLIIGWGVGYQLSQRRIKRNNVLDIMSKAIMDGIRSVDQDQVTREVTVEHGPTIFAPQPTLDILASISEAVKEIQTVQRNAPTHVLLREKFISDLKYLLSTPDEPVTKTPSIYGLKVIPITDMQYEMMGEEMKRKLDENVIVVNHLTPPTTIWDLYIKAYEQNETIWSNMNGTVGVDAYRYVGTEVGR
jgi:thiamine pyrophosphate-dependent acetolactate synthase large subunit-like protein